jgi:purine catabolism regulator
MTAAGSARESPAAGAASGGLRKLFTIRQALGHPCLARATLVAGHQGLGHPVDRVGVLDVTDLDAVNAGGLLFTNAYALLSVDLAELVHRLVERGVGGLGVKLSGYWAEMPEALVAAADRVGLPLLVLPEGPFDELVNPLLAAIADRQTESLRKSTELHGALTGAALREGGNPRAVVEILTRALGSPAAILNDQGEVLAATGPGGLLESERLRRRAVEASDAGPMRVGDEVYFVAPVPGPGPGSGAVCVGGVDPEDPFVRAALAHAAVVAGLVLVGRGQVERTHLRFERELLEDLVDRRLLDPDEARTRAAWVGWPLDRPYLVLVAGRPQWGVRDDDGPASFVVGERDLAALGRVLGEVRPVRLILRRPGVVVVAHLQPGDSPRELARSFAERLAARGEESGEADTLLAVSLPRNRVIELADAFHEASVAFLLSRAGEADGPRVVHFDDLGAIRLLVRARDKARLTAVARSVLGPLSDVRSTRSRELFETLDALLARNMRLSATASHMFFHYNTVRHRLARLHELMGEDLTSPAGRLTVSLAVAAIRLAEAEQQLAQEDRPARLPMASRPKPGTPP